ncbi:glycosyltransferase, partial [Acinetobacter nosocomialis]|uniref:glycosyltransferase n=1 Tax=Acinetobacter nosocomialis TaxID=106654 RepID=UPI0013D8CF90
AYKGFGRLAEAMAQLPEQAAVQLTIMGDGPLAAEVSALFANDPRVRLNIGWSDGSTRRVALAAHDAVV